MEALFAAFGLGKVRRRGREERGEGEGGGLGPEELRELRKLRARVVAEEAAVRRLLEKVREERRVAEREGRPTGRLREVEKELEKSLRELEEERRGLEWLLRRGRWPFA